MPQSFKRPFHPNHPKACLSQAPKHAETHISYCLKCPLVLEPHLCIGYAPVPEINILFLEPVYCFNCPVLRSFCPKLDLRHIYHSPQTKLNSLYGPLYSSAPNVLSLSSAILYHNALLTIPYPTIPYYSIIRETV